jgi:muconolactone delta-isomerase
MRFMVRFTFPEPGSEEIASRIPDERAKIRQLIDDGTVETLYLAADRSGGWIAMRGPSLARVEAALASLPLHPYMDVELTALQE